MIQRIMMVLVVFSFFFTLLTKNQKPYYLQAVERICCFDQKFIQYRKQKATISQRYKYGKIYHLLLYSVYQLAGNQEDPYRSLTALIVQISFQRVYVQNSMEKRHRFATILQYNMQSQQILVNSFINLEEPSFYPKQHFSGCLSHTLTKSNINSQEYSWMDQYLNLEVFKIPFQSNDESSPIQPFPRQSSTIQTSALAKESEKVEQASQRKNRSIFHNFQKHVITLLKRIVSIKRIQLLNYPCGLKAYQLWKLFKVSRDYTKKTLYMVFGVAQEENAKNFSKLAQQLPELQKMVQKSSIEEIQAAQALLRQKVGVQISLLQKQLIKKNCKMEKFEEFYSYFLNFLEELRAPGLSKRLRKEKKLRLVQNSMAQTGQQQ